MPFARFLYSEDTIKLAGKNPQITAYGTLFAVRQ